MVEHMSSMQAAQEAERIVRKTHHGAEPFFPKAKGLGK